MALETLYKRAMILTVKYLRKFRAKMLPISRIMLAVMSWAVLAECTEGNQRIVHISELISDDEDFFTNGEDGSSHICCLYGNCTCSSLDHALAYLTSNVLINITTNITLSSFIKVSGLQNVSVIGHNSVRPTVNCEAGGIHFTFCHYCIIRGITWDGCGIEITDNLTEPGIKLNCSSNVTVQKCSFQHSVGQALVLSEVSGDVNINNCNFVNNSHYGGHGAAIHYSSSNTKKFSQFVFIINNCNFTNNKHIKSLIYIENKLFKYHKIMFNNSEFSNNQGISVHVINHKIYINGKALFHNNVAEDGTGIYISDHSTVVFGENANVTFTQNLANDRGGAVFLTNNSYCFFYHNSIVTFYYNKATNGGAIYSEDNSHVTFNASCKVTFNSNSASQYGTAIYSLNFSHIIFGGSTSAIFYGNNVHNKSCHSFGGIIYSHNHCVITFDDNACIVFRNNTGGNGGVLYSNHKSYISFEANSTTEFSNNTADYGGAILSYDNCYISFKGNSATEFCNNAADYGGAILSNDNSHIFLVGNFATKFSNNTAMEGGAIYLEDNCTISFEGNSTAAFCNNTAVYGGAILSNVNSHIYLEGSSVTKFNNNTAMQGGAIYSEDNCSISFEINSITEFTNNAAYYGGAIFSYNCNISLEGNSATKFNNNIAMQGGAIYLQDTCNISVKRNSTTQFSNNTADHGGAICSNDHSFMSLEETSATKFSKNTAKHGGAIYLQDNCRMSFKGNTTTEFSNNTAEYGGAIFSYDNVYISLEKNSAIELSNNTAKHGAAIYSRDNCNISFEGNSTAEFSNNTANYGGAITSEDYCYISFEGNSTTEFSNNAADYGGSIQSQNNCYISFKENCTTEFSNNVADFGGAILSTENSLISFEGHSTTEFSNNTNGAILANNQCGMTFDNNSVVFFSSNTAAFDTTILYNYNSKIIVKGNSSVIFNNLPAQWCFNACLKHPGKESDSISIDSNGIVWCGNQKAFICQSNKCHCKNLEDALANATHNKLVNITDEVVVLSSVIILNSSNISIIGHNYSTVMCVNNGGLSLHDCSNLSIEGITFIGCGAVDYIYDVTYIHTPVLEINGCNNVRIQQCSFQYSMGQAVWFYNVLGYVNINSCRFANHTHYRGPGAAICIYDGAFDAFAIRNCNFSSNEAESVIFFSYRLNGFNNIYLINSNFHNNKGISIHLSSHHNLYITGEVLFEGNLALDGAGIYISDHCTIMFGEKSNSVFFDNDVYRNGAAIFLNNNSSVIFDNNSIVTFNDNAASNGTIYCKASSHVIFKAACKVTFRSNSAATHGSAIYSCDNSQVIFRGNSRVTFGNNVVSSDDAHLQQGEAILSENNGYIAFEEKSITGFSNNSGSAIFSIRNSNVIFKNSSRVMFNNNIARYCGILTSALFSNITFTDNAKVIYDTNTVSYILSSNDESYAGAISIFQRSEIIFTEYSLVTFSNNKIDRGGSMMIFESNVVIEKFAIVIFNNNFALYSSGGAFICSNNSNVVIKGNSNVTFNNNKASQSGGAIHSYNMCRITLKDNSTSTFINNIARNNGGTIFSNRLSKVTFEGNSVAIFDGNTADNGGVFYFINSTIIFEESSAALFHGNKARQHGGVGYFKFNSQVIFEGTTGVRFDNNTAEKTAGVIYSIRSNFLFKENSIISVTNNKATFDGGALYFDKNSDASFTEFANLTFQYNRAFYGGAILTNEYSNITVTGHSVLLFVSNEATQSGGAGYFNYSCNFIIKETSVVTFNANKAFQGGALCINDRSKLTIMEESTVFFYNNLGTVGGGAVKVFNYSSITLNDNITMKFTNNNAQYGGAIFLDITAVMVNSSYKRCIYFTNNIAKVSGNSVYQDADEFCNSSFLSEKLVGISSEFIDTPPNELKFSDPAICIDNDNGTQCNSYYVQNIMLGMKIVIPACVLNYHKKPINSTQFLVQSKVYSNYFISGPKQILISCDTFEGISIMSNQSLSKSVNFSIKVMLNVALNSNWKQISVNLIIELTPCHPGFWQYPKSWTCECYNASDILFCSGSSSTIKRGYWFGSVTGKPTVTFCPINYCNFTCCETSNGYYHLSPVRDNQCRSHRSGTACGSCEEGYTLSFDSDKCVHINECGIGWTILVLALVVLYWIIITVAVFSLMHFKVGIGHLYAITYYYSIVGLLLSQNWYHSDALYTIINILSSVANIIPQFLGQFCFIANMSGIDQQFIHYIHPVAISLFLVMITVLARRSHRLSVFISKGIIHVICCLLLLSYTSLATTSLLLMRPLIFHDVDKVYTYVSPDVEYFHGRHLVYAIVAVLFTIVIVIGLPLLLALEPFLNSLVNFVKIKPLLDQFQGCYKDKYRCFAAYYMICRLIIITIIIANSSNEYVFKYLLISACVLMGLTHQSFRPYSNSWLNIFDGVILHFIVLVSVLPQVDSFSNFNSDSAMGITFILVILPLLIFITMSIIINKEKIKKLPGYCYFKCSQLHLSQHQCNEIPLNEIPLIKTGEDEYINIIDDNKRKNATICDV